MKVSLSLNIQNPLNQDMVSALQDRYTLVHEARDAGWDNLCLGQHFLNTGNSQQLQLVPLLARVQAEAGEMGVIIGIMLLNLHNPVYTAESIATLDTIWKGNLKFGVGLGYREIELDAFQVRKGERVKRFEDCLNLIKRLWSEESVSFESDYCRLDNVRMNLRPVQQPHPPIWIAANNDNAVRRAARLGDAWHVNGHSMQETIVRQLKLYREELAACGKPEPSELPASKEIFCAKDRATAVQMAAPYLGEKYKDYASWGQDQVMPDNETFAQPFEDLVRDRFILGSPADCYEQLRPYWEDLGVTHFIFRTCWVGMPISTALANTRMISQELLPELHKI